MPPRRRKTTDALARAVLGVRRSPLAVGDHRLKPAERVGEQWRTACDCGWAGRPMATPKLSLTAGAKHVLAASKAAKGGAA